MNDSQYSRGESVKAGYLVKSPPISRQLVSQWHRRWFILMDSRLVYPLAERFVRMVYYQSEADAKRLVDPKGSINLSSCLSVVSLNESIRNYKFVFDVCTSERVYHLAADTEEERLDWVTTLKDLLFGPQQMNGVNSNFQQQSKGPEVVKREKDGPRQRRPVSFTGGGHQPRAASVSVQARPLPPVPGSVGSSVPNSPVERRNRPLPATPNSSTQIHPVGQQSTQVPIKKTNPPPKKPTPYKKNKSEPSPPLTTRTEIKETITDAPRAISLSPPPQQLLAEEYQVCVFQTGSSSSSIDNTQEENNYSLATDVPKDKRQSAPNCLPVRVSTPNEDYSILTSSTIPGYDPKDQDYSHLQPSMVTDSPPPPVRHASLSPHPHADVIMQKPQPKARTRLPHQRPRSALPDYVNYPSPPAANLVSDDGDYSHLHH